MSPTTILLVSAAASLYGVTAERPNGAGAARGEARVAVRIVAGARINAGENQAEGMPLLSDTVVRSEDGSLRRARLVEFD